LCKVRVVTMSLRIAWTCHPTNVGLGIAANVFVYVGTIILFMIDWFFVQRIVRAQHQRLGWSSPYRIFHRLALVVLIITLIMLITVNIWQSFTINATKIHVFRALQLTGQTYFTIFCFAPAVLVLISVLIPRREVEKFGAGRLRINITILLIAVAMLTTGQLFRCVIAWIPQTPVRDSAGQPVAQPWYLHKICFYVFNFVTEIAVVIMFAIVRVDLRFHVPNGSRMSGDYSGRNSRIDLVSNVDLRSMASKRSLACVTPSAFAPERSNSTETLHKYETSVFEDSGTLADSLKYSGSKLEVDDKTGAYKVKRLSSESNSSRCSTQSLTRSLNHERSVSFADEAPPVPNVPSEWPLANAPPPNSSMSSIAYSNPPSRRGNSKKTFEIANHDLNGADVGDAIADALAALEQDSLRQSSPSPNEIALRSRQNPLAPRKHASQRASHPTKSALRSSRSHNTTASMSSYTPTIIEAPELLQRTSSTPARPVAHSKSIEIIPLSQRSNSDARRIIDLSLQGDKGSDVSLVPKGGSPQSSVQLASREVSGAPSTTDDKMTKGSNAKEHVPVGDEQRRFSFEDDVVPGQTKLQKE
jgi:hypothetical protein